MAAVWQRQAVLSECSHRVDNVCQLVLLIAIKDGTCNILAAPPVMTTGTAGPGFPHSALGRTGQSATAHGDHLTGVGRWGRRFGRLLSAQRGKDVVHGAR
jgi:hypothetical protein